METLQKVATENGWTPEHDAYLAKNPNLFTEFFNTLTSLMSGLIDSFFKLAKQIVLEPTDQEFNVKRDLSKIVALKAYGGKLDYLDDEIIKWFGKVTVKGRKEKVVAFVYRFLKNLHHRDIIATGEKFKIYRRYNIFDALTITAQLVDAGEIEERGKGVFIYLEEERDGSLCLLGVWRNGAGELRLFVLKVYSGSEWNAGSGTVFS